MKSDPRIDAYIDRAAPFARPVLAHLRDLVGKSCPEAEETIKWGFPHFVLGGAILCSMAAFKAHVAFGFWQNRRVTGEQAPEKDAMGQFGRIAAIADLPDPALLGDMIARAARLIESGEKAPRPLKHARPPVEPPADLIAALGASPRAAATFEGFPPGQRREYVDWITGAKREETRRKRLDTTIAQLEEGKRLNWKYERG
ncbi:YdeI/OmpD-associated family protein [Sphingomonas sp. YL-JM2C]